MNWSRWYIEGGNAFIYYAATGHRPGFKEITGRAFYKHRDEVRESIVRHNKIWKKYAVVS